MRQTIRVILAGVFILLLVGAYFYFNNMPAPKKSAPPTPPVKVTTAQVVQKDVNVPLQAIGTVEAYSTISVQSLVSGELLKIGFNEGDFVKSGQLLFVIDPRPFVAALNQAQANLDRDQAQLTNAHLLVVRNAPLVKKGYIAQQDFDQLVSNEKALQGTVDGDKAAVNNATLQLAYTKIYAPISGHTGSLLVNAGNVIEAPGNTVLVSITQTQPIYVTFSVPQQYLPTIQAENEHSPLSVTLNLGNKTEKGKLSFINNTVDTSTGTIELKSTFANLDNALWPGQFVTASLSTTTLPHALIIPTQAIQAGQNDSYVYVIKPDSTVTYQSIVTGPIIGSDTVVLKGLQAGQQVVLDGQLRLTDGSRVKVIDSLNGSAS